jgi:hypothetical protein
MKKQTRVLVGLCILVFGAIACYSFLQFFSEYILRARDSEAKTVLSSYVAAQNAFFTEYHSYSKQAEAIGYSAEGKLSGKLYTSRDDLPAEVSRLIYQSQEPYIAQDSFRVLYVMGEGSDIRIFSVDQKKVFSRLR